jgi:hypothetical protein
MTLCSLINVSNVSEVPTASIVRVEDGGSKFSCPEKGDSGYLGNIDNCLPDYVVS